MGKEILIAMKSQDRLQDILPCLEKVAQPGTRVTFLYRYPVDGFIRANEVEEFGRSLAEAKRLTEYYSWEGNQKRAEAKVAPAFKALGNKGVEVSVDVYASSLKKALKTHAPKGGVNLVMRRAGIGQWIAGFFNGINPVLRLVKRPSFSPVLIQPRAAR